MKAVKLINENLRQIVKKKAGLDLPFGVQPSDRSENGEYFTNVALRLASKLKKKPLDIAYDIKNEAEKLLDRSIVYKIDVAPPGFVNFFLSDKYLAASVEFVNKKSEDFGRSDAFEGQKVMIEFTDPNPFKEFHIGHLYSNIVGESLSRLFEAEGAKVIRVCYQGDVGLHVAKAIYGMQKLVDQMPKDDAPLSVRAQFMGGAYALGAKDYEENESVKKEIHELNKKIYGLPTGRQGRDKSIGDFYKKGRTWSLEYFDFIYKRLGTKFEKHYFESEVGPEGIKIVRKHLKKGRRPGRRLGEVSDSEREVSGPEGIFEESEGAVIFPGKKHGLHNRVFINSIGLPTYEAKDLGLAPKKYEDFQYDRSIIITAEEQSAYFTVVLKALELISPEIAKKTTHIAHGMVRLPGGKMSSRTGNVITGEWLMDEAVSRIQKDYSEMDRTVAEKVGLAAIKYALLKIAVGHDVEFNFDESISLNGASGPYLQYTYVRTRSVLEKNNKSSEEKNFGLNNEEKEVLRQLVYFPEVVSDAANKLSPNLVASYLFDLAQKYNLFYQKHKIAGNNFRLELTGAVGQTLKNGLKILGIETVGRM